MKYSVWGYDRPKGHWRYIDGVRHWCAPEGEWRWLATVCAENLKGARVKAKAQHGEEIAVLPVLKEDQA